MKKINATDKGGSAPGGKEGPVAGSPAAHPPHAEKLDALVRLAMDITHRVNNSLAASLNYIFVLREAYSDETAKELLKKVEKGIHSSKETLQELVDLSHPSSGVPDTLDIKDEIAGILSGFTGLEFGMDFKGPLKVRASRLSLDALMTKLMVNAVEAGATLMRIRGRQEAGRIALFISDNGRGMTPEEIGRAFEPLFTTKAGHKGLGLYSSYFIVRSFGGCLSCSPVKGGTPPSGKGGSAPSDKISGFEFKITLPMA